MALVGTLLALVGLLPTARSALTSDWEAFNATLGGRLFKAEPVARPCFSLYNGNPVQVEEAACAAIRGNYTANAYRIGIPGAFMNTQSELCLSDPGDQCLLDNTVTPARVPPANATCNQGSVPEYYIDVESAQNVVDAFAFAKAEGLSISIKNSGHDYMTRNSLKSPSSISLWVHNLKGLTHWENFKLDGCNRTVGRAMTVAAGETTGAAYESASRYGSTILGGYSPTIALSGGWVQGGGHAVLSPVYGLGADRVVEFKIVTPDGELRTASVCQNADLFRALRGGGGGTFGVVLEATHRVEKTMPIAVASITIPSNSTADVIMQWIELQVRESSRWGQEGWGGHVAGLYLKHMNPLPEMANLSDSGAAAESMRRATEFALSVGGTSVVEVLPDWLVAWNKYVVPGAANSAGTSRLLTSRLVPRDLFATEEGIAKIMAYINSTRALGFEPKNFYVPVETPFVANSTSTSDGDIGRDHGTSVHPAWYGALWSLSAGLPIPWNATLEQRLQNITALTNVTQLAEDLTGPEGGAYLNEANPFTQDWQAAWWGSHYDFLNEMKQKYDPDGILNCWKCVGYTEVQQSRYPCQGQFDNAMRQLF
ncbi:hypothetical protein BJ170DRAFT_147998 [Xylariales sp. AK1849]|nr:hypothetical protein BJ170DRAFT_147998 [Xylariales sp. AK1849]